MTNKMKEQVFSSVEEYGKSVENAAYDKVLNILWLKYNQLNNVLTSKEARNIFLMSRGPKFDKLSNKRKTLRSKIYLILDFIEEVSIYRFGKY